MSRFRQVVPALVALALLCTTSLALAPAPAAKPKPEEELSADTPLVAEPIRQLMQDRKYAEAVKAIDEAAKAKDAPVDYLAYLKGRALYLAGKYDEAVGQFEAWTGAEAPVPEMTEAALAAIEGTEVGP